MVFMEEIKLHKLQSCLEAHILLIKEPSNLGILLMSTFVAQEEHRCQKQQQEMVEKGESFGRPKIYFHMGSFLG